MSSRSGASSASRWDQRVRVPEASRLVWYGPAATPEAWLDYWRQRLVPGYYDKARRCDLARHPLGRILLRELDPAGLHLEAGCGAGFWVAALGAAGFRVEGIESAEPLVELVAASDSGLPVRHGDALAVDGPDGSYDSYLSFGVVEHRREGPEPFLTEAFRLLRPGGLLVLSAPHFGPVRRLKARLGRYPSTVTPELPFYQYGFSIPELVRIVEAPGFSVRGAVPIEGHRLLEEESAVYRRIAARPSVKRITERVLARVDGHMAVVVANRPASS